MYNIILFRVPYQYTVYQSLQNITKHQTIIIQLIYTAVWTKG